MESSVAPSSSSRPWRPAWWAGWLHLPLALFAMLPYLDLALERRPGWPEYAIGMTLLGLFLLGVFSPRLQAFGPVLCGPRPGVRPRVALTFDDGPDPETTPRVLDALGEHRATFFVIGEKAKRYPELIAAMRAAGHQICSHGIQHSWSLVVSPWRARKLTLGGLRALSWLGVRGRRFFRAPYGLMTPPLMSVLRETGITPVGWSLRSWDSIHPGPADDFAIRLAQRARNGDIILLHDAPEHPGGRRPLGIEATATLVRALTSRGFDLVTVETLYRGDGPEDPLKTGTTTIGERTARRSRSARRNGTARIQTAAGERALDRDRFARTP
ncbi:polysaccharide deacetylase family protein [Thiorhodococcus fuscus]|uniref:Polysaccharide deacetylase family protein n=1 Tax=Thiorhodococcus fuscus TaxID=527200 RepID=A0ABW4YD51_9GAMM